MEPLSGVAISDVVTGPYRFLDARRPNAGHWPTNVAETLKRPISVADTALLAGLKLKAARCPIIRMILSSVAISPAVKWPAI